MAASKLSTNAHFLETAQSNRISFGDKCENDTAHWSSCWRYWSTTRIYFLAPRPLLTAVESFITLLGLGQKFQELNCFQYHWFHPASVCIWNAEQRRTEQSAVVWFSSWEGAPAERSHACWPILNAVRLAHVSAEMYTLEGEAYKLFRTCCFARVTMSWCRLVQEKQKTKDENVQEILSKARGYLARIAHCRLLWTLTLKTTSVHPGEQTYLPRQQCVSSNTHCSWLWRWWSSSSVEYALKIWWRNSPPLGCMSKTYFGESWF